MTNEKFITFKSQQFDETEMLQKSRVFYEYMNQRRSIREFSDRAVPLEIIKNCVMAASTAPSGAHKQPWTFALIQDPEIKKQMRQAAEEEEYINYHGRMSEEWLEDLKAFGTNHIKPFIEIAPWIIVVFKQIYELGDEQSKKNNYYVTESVGIACGMLLSAIHQAGLVALTHTPSPMNFLCKVLNKPENERPFLLIPVGYPADNVVVPDLKRKSFEQISALY